MPQRPDLVKREAWRRRFREFDRGSATITEFCRRARVPVWSFYYWQQRLRSGANKSAADPQRTGAANERPAAAPERHARFAQRTRQAAIQPRLNFVPVQVAGGRSVEVHLPNGTRVMVPCQDRDAIATYSTDICFSFSIAVATASSCSGGTGTGSRFFTNVSSVARTRSRVMFRAASKFRSMRRYSLCCWAASNSIR